MTAKALRSVWWENGRHVLGTECANCHVHVYPVYHMFRTSGFYGGAERFNYRFCSQHCIDEFKIERMKRWAERRTHEQSRIFLSEAVEH